TVIGCPVKSNPILRYNGDRSRFCLFILTACSYSIFLPLTLYQKTSTADSGLKACGNDVVRLRLWQGFFLKSFSFRQQSLFGERTFKSPNKKSSSNFITTMDK